MDIEAELDEIERIHDEQPAQAADRLRALDVAALPPERAALAAFLFNHVLGEKCDAWPDAAQRVARLREQLSEPPLAVTLHAAVADELADRAESPARAALIAASSEPAASCAIALRRLSFMQQRMDARSFAAALRELALRVGTLPTGSALDAQLAAGLNNTTSALLEIADTRDPTTRDALRSGAAQALRFWQAADTWVNHERALYLVALVANRVGDHARARDAARQALDLITANGAEEVDRAFLLLQLAGALRALGAGEAGDSAHAEARAIAGTWTEAWLTEWFATEEARLFGPKTGND